MLEKVEHKMDHETKISVTKAAIAWFVAILTDSTSFLWKVFADVPWDKLAQFAAFVYSLCLIYEHFRKKRRAKGDGNGTE